MRFQFPFFSGFKRGGVVELPAPPTTAEVFAKTRVDYSTLEPSLRGLKGVDLNDPFWAEINKRTWDTRVRYTAEMIEERVKRAQTYHNMTDLQVNALRTMLKQGTPMAEAIETLLPGEIERINQRRILEGEAYKASQRVINEAAEVDLLAAGHEDLQTYNLKESGMINPNPSVGMTLQIYERVMPSAFHLPEYRFAAKVMEVVDHHTLGVSVRAEAGNGEWSLWFPSRLIERHKRNGRPYIILTKATVDDPATSRYTRMWNMQMARDARHEVRGHWRVSDRSHGDRWQRFTDPLTMRPRWRIWIEHHERGDASLGWVRQFYNVEGKRAAA